MFCNYFDVLYTNFPFQVRNWIMPINRKYNLNLLLGTLREELLLRPKSIVLFEYVMLAGVNDRSGIFD
jgi:adenine C2-methylase RlmN of 23S rRNA A2503 and tRNA A37